MEWYSIANIENIDSPALLLYKDRIAGNILKALELIKNPDLLRPHVKTSKIAEVCKMMIDAGINKFKCATIAEAEMLAMTGAADVLFAYQPVGPKAKRLLMLDEQYPKTRFSCLVDDADAASFLSGLFEQQDKAMPVYIDLNTGMNRTGILMSKASEFAEQLENFPGIQVVGLHMYDGHLRDTDLELRQKKSDAAFNEVMDLKQKLEKAYKRTFKIVGGGSPSFPTHINRNMECSPGTFVFWDWGYKHQLPDEPFDYAALVITRVISVVDDTTITTDLGHKSVAAENPFPRVHFLNAPELEPVGQSEEHLVLKNTGTSKYKVGDVLYGVPIHICPTVALYETAVVVENNHAVGAWRVVARDRRIHI